MIKSVFTNSYQKICLAFFIILIVFWVFINFYNEIAVALFSKLISSFNFDTEFIKEFPGYLFAFLYGPMPLIAGIIAIVKARQWGNFKSIIGKSMILIGFGIASFGLGEIIWSYYNFNGVEVPYPSFADIGFVFNAIFSNLGVIYLAIAIGARSGLRGKYAVPFIIIITILVSIFSYYLLVQVARGGVILSDRNEGLKVFLDIFYPLSDFFALITAVLVSGLSFKYIGGKYLYNVIAILLGISLMFFADFGFSYTTTIETFFNGNWVDLLYTTSLFFTSFGILGFAKKL